MASNNDPSVPSDDSVPSVEKKGGRGGPRPGSGAPKGNLNALKHGRYSQQFAVIGKLLAADPRTREALLTQAAKMDQKMQHTTEITALLLAELVNRARGKRAVRGSGFNLTGGGGEADRADRLNMGLRTTDWESIVAAHRQLVADGYEIPALDALGMKKPKNTRRNNQTPDTPGEKTTRPQIQKHIG